MSPGEAAGWALGAGLVAVYAALAWLWRRRPRRDDEPARGLDVASLDCGGLCRDMRPHAIDGALAHCIVCGALRLAPSALRHDPIEDQP
ncbi:hypothetical protein [Streptomyces boncukensis]|uniref:Uncharacterized protein n=1 Tax=Streptomyces boncukensis TaxID=2711219 RepID=A0A6G4WX17_9ACTN|nr:hypothetical protein [Streptomyces boncukensis]NGO69157.1 hypothetical protein [Streptomyces boncukensis]